MRVFILILVSAILFFSCENRNESKINEKKDSDVHDSATTSSLLKSDLKVSACLIYEDGTLSTFDVLNDKSIALWNVISGGGDALKSSNNTKISLNGDLDSLNIKIKNGKKVVIDTTIMRSDSEMNYIIKNTGCVEVYVTVARNKNVLYNDTIPFHCGE